MRKETQTSRLTAPARLAACLMIVVLLLQSVWALDGPRPSSEIHPSIAGLTGETLFAQLLEHNRLRSAHLEQYSGPRVYRIKKEDGKVRAETRVLFRYHAPNTKEFQIVSEEGSGFIRRHVINRLMENEVDAAAGQSKHDSSITPDNYTFEVTGESDVDGYHCFVVHAIPKRKDKYLFEGNIWIHAKEFAIVKTQGQPAKNPSFWIKRVDFIRQYQKVGEFWLPKSDVSVTQVRLLGKYTLAIDYEKYEIASQTATHSEKSN